MSFSFKPLTDEELDLMESNPFSLIDDGIYNFEVAKSTRKTSKAGNAMCELQLRIWDKEGKVHFIFDYLVFSQVNLNIRKVKHFCDTVGLKKEYADGNIPEALVGLCGKVEISQQESQPKPTGGYYPAKNIVVDYVMTDKGAVMPANDSANGMRPLPKVENDFVDDTDIPF